MCECEYEGPMAMRTVMRKARKEHRCCECSNTIKIGDIYEYVSGIWDNQASSYKTCGLCADVRSLIILIRRIDAAPLNGRRSYDVCWPAFSLLYDYWDFATFPAHTGLKRRLPMAA